MRWYSSDSAWWFNRIADSASRAMPYLAEAGCLAVAILITVEPLQPSAQAPRLIAYTEHGVLCGCGPSLPGEQLDLSGGYSAPVTQAQGTSSVTTGASFTIR